jgi:WD40 repeat protein
MKCRYRSVAVMLAWCGLCAAVSAQSPTAVARKQSFSVPILAAPEAKPPRSLECVIPFGPPAPTAAVAFSPDGKLLATGGYQEVLLWDLANAKLLKRLGAGQVSDLVQAVAFRSDGRLLAVAEGAAHGAGAVKLFDVQAGQVAAAFAEPKDVTYAVGFSPDGKLLAAGGADGLLRVWSVDEKKLVTAIQGHGNWIVSVGFSADGKLLVSAGADRSAQVWEAGSWKRLAKLDESDALQAAALSPDGQLVVLATAGTNDKMLRLRRRDNGEQVRTIDLGTVVPLDVVWLAQGNRLYVPCSDKTVRVYDAGNGAWVATLTGHANWVYRVAVTPDGARLASASADGTVKLWVPNESRLLATLVQLTPRTDEWLIVTPAGYLATSSPGVLQWKATGVQTPADKLAGMLQNVELLKQAIAGNKIATPTIP